MSTNFASQLKNTILQLELNPEDPFGYDLTVPSALIQQIRLQLNECTKSMKNGANIFRHLSNSDSFVVIIRQILAKLNSIGMEWEKDSDTVKESFKYALKYLVLNYPCHLAWSPVRSGLQHSSVILEDIDERIRLTDFSYVSPLYELEYGIANSLINWNGNRWQITPLGDFYKSLSYPAGTVFLLLIEKYFSLTPSSDVVEHDPWHMNFEFLKSMYEKEFVVVDVGEGKYTLLDLDPNMTYLNRLEDLGLICSVDRTEERRYVPENSEVKVLHMGDEYFEINLSEYGKLVVGECLQKENSLFSLFVKNLVAFELTGSNYFNFRESYDAQSLIKIAEESGEITGDQLGPIKSIISDLKSGASPILILRSTYPTMEAILKNVLLKSGQIIEADVSSITWEPACQKFEALLKKGLPILDKVTIQFVRSLNRNELLHGNFSPNDEFSRSIINLMLNVLLKIYQDYNKWNSIST